jgi:hypothetical protein
MRFAGCEKERATVKMTVLFELLSSEAIENVVTCLNYRIDAVVFFGSQKLEDKYRSAERFLKNYCDVGRVEMYDISQMEQVIVNESQNKNSLFFDITGGEEDALVSAGPLSDKYGIAAHKYDIPSNTLKDVFSNNGRRLCDCAAERRIDLTPEKYISLYGGFINEKLNKHPVLQEKNENLAEYAYAIFRLKKKYGTKWNTFFSFFTDKLKINEDGLSVSRNSGAVLTALNESGLKRKMTPKKMNGILDDLYTNGIISELRNTDGRFSFRFTDWQARELFITSGLFLEVIVYEKQKPLNEHCMMSVHFDWNGIIDPDGNDVTNEVDVLLLNGNIPTFISCKSGSTAPEQMNTAMYELQTIAARFGGKYAEKKLVIVQKDSVSLEKRAREMNIEIIVEKIEESP